VVTEEELIEGLSFPVYPRLSTVMFVPGLSASSIEMVAIDPLDLAARANSGRVAAGQGGALMSLVRHHERFKSSHSRASISGWRMAQC
jgi:hypothetical protein